MVRLLLRCTGSCHPVQAGRQHCHCCRWLQLDRFVESLLEPSYADVAAAELITLPKPCSTVEEPGQSPEAQSSDPDLAVFRQDLLRHSTYPCCSTPQLQAGPGLDAMSTKDGSSHLLPSRPAHASSSIEAAQIRGLGSRQARPEEPQADPSLVTNVAEQGSHLPFPLRPCAGHTSFRSSNDAM